MTTAQEGEGIGVHPGLLVDAAPCLVAYVDKDLVYRYANARYADWLGVEPSSIVGSRVPDVLGDAAWEKIRSRAEAALAGDRIEFVSEIRYANAATRWVRAFYVPDADAAGNVRGYAGFVLDVTTEEHTKAALAAKEADLREFVETSGIGLHWVASDGTILWANEADHRVLGYSRAEYVGRNIAEFHADEALIRDIMARLARNERLRQIEARLVAKDGSIRHVVIDSSVRWGPNGEFLHTQCFTQDVTERVRDAEELAGLREELARAEKLAALGSLVAGVAHEIRTPLTYLSNNVHFLSRVVERAATEGRLREEAEAVLEACAQTQAGVARIQALVGDLRRYMRGDESAPTLAALDGLAAQAIGLFEATNPRDCRIVREFAALPAIRLDRLRIQQVVLNLLQNALEAGAREILVALRAIDGFAELEVRDDGRGIPPDVLPRIFEPLVTTKPAGSGLGLSIAQKIVQGHGGTLSCRSEPGATSFCLRLPLDVPGALATPEDTSAMRTLEAGAPPLSRVTDSGP